MPIASIIAFSCLLCSRAAYTVPCLISAAAESSDGATGASELKMYLTEMLGFKTFNDVLLPGIRTLLHIPVAAAAAAAAGTDHTMATIATVLCTVLHCGHVLQ